MKLLDSIIYLEKLSILMTKNNPEGSKKLNILVIGMGNHARRIYLPTLNKFRERFGINIFGVDLSSTKESFEGYKIEKGLEIEELFLEPFDVGEDLPTDVSKKLNELVTKNNISAVIISTDPTTHKIYAKWALKNGLHILMDKPISTREGVVISSSQAGKIEEDYIELLNGYNKLQKEKDTFFLINTQRRFEAGFIKVFSLIREVSDRFKVPVTSIQAMHSDGVWIFPDETVEQKCHPYKDGYGKCSHSGFHLFDIVWQLYKAGQVKGKSADSAEVFTSFITPDGSLTQINQEDYARYFGDDYLKRPRRSNEELMKIFKDYGENDAFSIVKLIKKGVNVCNISINLLHNSFSRRSWVEPAKDLYKGNGRIKHQSFYIQQGPFQCVQIHNYQSNNNQEVSNDSDYDLGGNNHFDIYVFRNEKMFGGNQKPLEVISLRDLAASENADNSKLYHETAKDKVILEFIASINGEMKKEDSTSSITTYRVPVQIMRSIYQSHIKYKNKQNPLVKFDIDENENQQ
jgi:hypothetical protein